uniref:Uncharacterized protein n=1 Tax=Meloidogyne enterolobii TaxID=390850 RepID=A0A6V7UUA2_MELEN|nr:unnamed protein product [Meloidogyne enterolobii]
MIYIFKLFHFFPLIFLALASQRETDSPQTTLDPCRRQPFRGRCPPGQNGVQMRSQFVLRYYLRNGECISYPYGHCVNDESEPRLFRYKEECEDACTKNGGVGKEVTYATAGPVGADTTTTISFPSISTRGTTTTDAPKTEVPTTVVPKTECQRKRANVAEKGTTAATYVPECTIDGQYVSLQCMPNGNECFCVDKNGVELKHSRSRDRKPDCERISSAQPVLVQDCTSLPEPGPCTSNLIYWNFNVANGHCSQFNYSGCGGNGNKFGSRLECEQRCLSSTKKCPGGQLPLKDAQGLLVDCSNASCPPSFSCHSSICCQLILQKEPSREQLPILEGTSTTTIKILEASPLALPETEKSENICSLPKDRGPVINTKCVFILIKIWGNVNISFMEDVKEIRTILRELRIVKRCVCRKRKFNSQFLNKQIVFVPLSSSPLPVQPTTTTSKVFLENGKNIITEGKLPFSIRTTLPPPPPIEPDTPQLPVITFQPETDKQNIFSPLIPERSQQITPLLDVNRCQHPKDVGICAAQFVRWFWNSELNNCETFTYSGCGGNGNNFASREECLNICREELTTVDTSNDEKSACDVDIDPGSCGGIFMRYGFDRRTAQCRQFQYGGCEGNGNNFASLLDCRRRCLEEPEGKDEIKEPLSPNICEHRIDPGTCSGTFHRFGYETLANRCTRFVYGGCGGNGNNFASIDDCRAACVRHICPPEPECDTRGRCQLVKDSKGCSLCSCPPPRHSPIIPSVPPLAPPAVEPHKSTCPQLDVKLCQEPCIIFLNRRGCRECVCPIITPPTNSFHESPPAPLSIQESPSPPSIQTISVPQINKPQQQQRPLELSSAAPLPPASFSSFVPSSTVPPPAPPAIQPPRPAIIGGVPFNKALEPLPPPTTTTELPLPSSLPSRSQPVLTKKLPQNLAEAIISQPATPEPLPFGHNEICTQPLDIGASACSRFVQRWYFSSESGQCESFSYTGCAGNRNHFFSKKECQIYCARFSSDTQSELPVDSANEFSSQFSTLSPETQEELQTTSVDQITTDIPLPTISTSPQLPPVQHMIIPHIQNKNEICSLPPVAGPCTSFVLRWFFNPENGICEQFSYGSCRGNLNNFPDKSQCEAICLDIPQKVRLNDRCILDRDEGTGTGYNVHWYFNVRNLRCEQFIWQGNDGNANRFDTESECRSICEQQTNEKKRLKETDDLTQLNIPPPAGRMKGGDINFNQFGAKTANTQNEIGDVGIPAPFHAISDDVVAKSTDVEPTTDSLNLMAETNEPESNFEQSTTISQAPRRENANDRDGYSAVLLPKEPQKMPDLPLLGPSMPAVIDYPNGIRLNNNNNPAPQPLNVVNGLPQHIPEQNSANKNMLPTQFNDDKSDKDSPLFSFSKSLGGTIANGVPICPNGLNTMLYSDGRPVLCLPGMGQCPEKSVCYFNGIDYFCCPNEDDPYDQHIFGGYDGEELKHGYKAGGNNQQQQSSLRVRRQNDKENGPSSSLVLTESLRFDDKSPPGPIQRQSRFHGGNVKGSTTTNPSICSQPLNKGNCGEALQRYFYDSESDRCRTFYFTGCGGNENKFETLIDCERICKKGVLGPESPKEQQNSFSQKRPGVCPGGNLPLGGRNPVLCGEHYDSIGCPTGYLCVPGPPSVCCPTKYEKSEIRRKPQQNLNTEQMLEVKPALTEENLHLKNQNIAELNVHLMLCSDGSDPLRNETSGDIISCGAGLDIDGQAHCEYGFYCSIDPDSNTRFCCPLQAQGAKLDSSSSSNLTEALAPHFGRRPPNPGEVLGRGSHPSDRRPNNRVPLSSSFTHRKNSSSSSTRHDNVEFGQLRIERSKLGAIGDEKNARKINSKDWRPSEEDPFESAAICLLRPDEGRDCARGEKPPRSNLQFFYSSRDGMCKVFFIKGCGGNGNKFASKEECERRCLKR